MKKIERLSLGIEEDGIFFNTITVKESDLDELEQQAALLEDDSPEGHKVTNQQYINILSEKQELERQRDEAIEMVKALLMYPNYKRELVDKGGDVVAFLEKLTGQSWEEIKEKRGC